MNINKIAKFEKVSFEQFKKDWLKNDPLQPPLDDVELREIYDNIQLPKRATTGSAGYDFFMPTFLASRYNPDKDRHEITIPTGIRCRMYTGWVLQLYPRSGMGFKYGVRLSNSVGIIDSDYYNAENEGHIMVKLVDVDCVSFKEGLAFCQGIFVPYGITIDDDTEGQRTGGFGSTGNM